MNDITKQVIHIDGKAIVLVYPNYSDVEINTEELTRIDYSNLYGESVTISALLNIIGKWRAEMESHYEHKALERHVMEADLEKKFRREAARSEGKFSVTDKEGRTAYIKLTENSVASAIISDIGYQTSKRNEIEAKRAFGIVDSLYWAAKSKDTKLNNLLPKVTPAEFYNELTEGRVNMILIKKPTK